MPPRKSDVARTSLPSHANPSPAQLSLELRAETSTLTAPEAQTSSAVAAVAAAAPVPKYPNTKPKTSKLSDAEDGTSIEDLTLPKSIITRLAKGVLPPNTQIQGNGILAIQKGSTVFISYIAGMAAEIAAGKGRKTISPADVFEALAEGEFGGWVEGLEAELGRFNEIQAEKRNTYRSKVKEKGTKTEKDELSKVEGRDDGASRGAKKARMNDNADVTMDEGDTQNLEEETLGDEGDVEDEAEVEEEVQDDEGEEDEEEAEDGAGEDEDGEEESAEDVDVDDGDEALDNGEDSD